MKASHRTVSKSLGLVLLVLGFPWVASSQSTLPPNPNTKSPAPPRPTFVPGTTTPANPAPKSTRPSPKLEAVAETSLLMEAINLPNFRALEKILREKSPDADAYKFARGQALLIAESGNLLMLRPPKTTQGQDAWLSSAGELRQTATKLARATAEGDLGKSRLALLDVANSCNRCHESFRVATRIQPFRAAATEE